MQVSVTVITRNEEERIQATLQSVSWAAEKIVVDSGSTDRTVALAREITPNVVHHEFTNFADQKNFAQSLASHEWILSLDADEICTPDLADEIQSLSEQQSAGYLISRMNFFQGKHIRHCGWSPDYKLRLYRKSQGQWNGKVHESIDLQKGVPVKNLKGRIQHYTYKTFDRYLASIHQYSKLAAAQMREKGQKASLLDLVLRPPVAFLNKYFLKLGLLDGRQGFVISMLTAYSIFCRYSMLSDLSLDGQTHEDHPR